MELIDRNGAITMIRELGCLSGVNYSDIEIEDDVVDMLESCTVVDAIQVVRCRDCKNWERRKSLWVEIGKCKHNGADVKECDFCSYGEPRTSFVE